MNTDMKNCMFCGSLLIKNKPCYCMESKVKLKKMCVNCANYLEKYCYSEELAKKFPEKVDENYYDKLRIAIKDNNKKCKCWQINHNLISKMFT